MNGADGGSTGLSLERAELITAYTLLLPVLCYFLYMFFPCCTFHWSP